MCQHQLIHNQKSVGTFSINVCGVMFLSNFLRIGFFIYKEFSIALLAQSILNILMQVYGKKIRSCYFASASKQWAAKVTTKPLKTKMCRSTNLCSNLFGDGEKLVNTVIAVLFSDSNSLRRFLYSLSRRSHKKIRIRRCRLSSRLCCPHS